MPMLREYDRVVEGHRDSVRVAFDFTFNFASGLTSSSPSSPIQLIEDRIGICNTNY